MSLSIRLITFGRIGFFRVFGLRLGYTPAALACKCLRTTAHAIARKPDGL
jgi:hypothetical protein